MHLSAANVTILFDKTNICSILFKECAHFSNRSSIGIKNGTIGKRLVCYFNVLLHYVSFRVTSKHTKLHFDRYI